MANQNSVKAQEHANANILQIGENIIGHVEGDVLYLQVDLSARLRDSGTGKSTIVASTGGNVPIPGTKVIAGLNLYVKKS